MIVRIEREFSGGGFIRRLKAPVDGPAEGSFLACSCWLADCMSMQGRHDDARARFERVLAVRNDADCWQKSTTFPAAIFPATSRGRFRISPSSGLSGAWPGRSRKAIGQTRRNASTG
ncbi:hypothetical protein [Paraburkholderia tropica]|uniref:hypothetical protein n=1 Tax=Paraburkholderia tropica TaxID=92647 RepID=UPI000AD866EB|nr:hypothetical protein [Paraburkholderia tropica]